MLPTDNFFKGMGVVMVYGDCHIPYEGALIVDIMPPNSVYVSDLDGNYIGNRGCAELQPKCGRKGCNNPAYYWSDASNGDKRFRCTKCSDSFLFPDLWKPIKWDRDEMNIIRFYLK